MPLHVRPLERADLPIAHELWNAIYIHDRVDLLRFAKIIFGDPHVKPDGAFVALECENIVGFAVCATPDDSKDVTFLKGLVGHKDATIAALLDHAESLACSRGSHLIRAVHYLHGPYFFPGIDKRYAHLLARFHEHGYAEREEARDVHLHLKDFTVSDRQREKIERVKGDGIEVRTYDQQWASALRDFNVAVGKPTWFLEEPTDEPPANEGIMAIKGNDVIGFCEYRTNGEMGDFGPLAVREEYREKGIGSALLIEAMLRMQKRGLNKLAAAWVWPLRLYESNGWEITRRYSILEKTL